MSLPAATSLHTTTLLRSSRDLFASGSGSGTIISSMLPSLAWFSSVQWKVQGGSPESTLARLPCFCVCAWLPGMLPARVQGTSKC